MLHVALPTDIQNTITNNSMELANHHNSQPPSETIQMNEHHNRTAWHAKTARINNNSFPCENQIQLKYPVILFWHDTYN